MYKLDENFVKRFGTFARFFLDSRGTNHNALRTLRFMKHQSHLSPDLYCTWIDVLALAGERAELRTVLEEMRKHGVSVDQNHYKRLMQAMSGFREFRECEELARDMKAQSIKPSPDFFDLLRGNPGLAPAWEILRKDTTRNILQPAPVTQATSSTTQAYYATLRTPSVTQPVSNAQINTPQAQTTPDAAKAAHAITNAAQTTKVPSGAEQDANTHSSTFIAHITRYIKTASEKECDQLLRELQSKFVNVALYNMLISNAPNERIGWMILNGMVANGLKPTVYTFNTLLRCSSTQGLKGCTAVLAAMKVHGMIFLRYPPLFFLFFFPPSTT
jgi:pentatricopeptide repeat protein